MYAYNPYHRACVGLDYGLYGRIQMITCCDCGKPITTKEFWRRHYYGETEYYCDKCAYSHMDERSYGFGLMLTTKDAEEIKDE